jgi:hypothetical protein
METHLPAPRPQEASAKTSLAKKHAQTSEQRVPHHGLDDSNDAFLLSRLLGPHKADTEDTPQKWSNARTLWFVFASCGLFWLTVALAVWAYRSGH